MRISTFIGLLLGVLPLISCNRTQSNAPPTGERSVERRVADLEQHLNANTPPISEAEARKQFEHDLKEIQRMGLVERAQRDIGLRLTNATIDKWTIGYLRDTNMVWCDVQYRLPGRDELLQQEFGYSRKDGTNWSLIWRVGGQLQ
jgi:hypothetical protein